MLLAILLSLDSNAINSNEIGGGGLKKYVRDGSTIERAQKGICGKITGRQIEKIEQK